MRFERDGARLFLWGALIVFLLACSLNCGDEDDLTEEVLSCEEAVSKLVECCPGFDPYKIECKDITFDNEQWTCGTTFYANGHQLPAFNREESQCIRERSCSELAVKGVCLRAQQAMPRGVVERRQGSPTATPTVTDNNSPPVCQ